MPIAPQQGPNVVFADPLRRLVQSLRDEAEVLRRAGAEDKAKVKDTDADGLERAIAAAASGDWMLTEDAARLLKITPDSVRARCRRDLKARGLAKKEGGTWYVHVDALPRRTDAAA